MRREEVRRGGDEVRGRERERGLTLDERLLGREAREGRRERASGGDLDAREGAGDDRADGGAEHGERAGAGRRGGERQRAAGGGRRAGQRQLESLEHRQGRTGCSQAVQTRGRTRGRARRRPGRAGATTRRRGQRQRARQLGSSLITGSLRGRLTGWRGVESESRAVPPPPRPPPPSNRQAPAVSPSAPLCLHRAWPYPMLQLSATCAPAALAHRARGRLDLLALGRALASPRGNDPAPARVPPAPLHSWAHLAHEHALHRLALALLAPLGLARRRQLEQAVCARQAHRPARALPAGRKGLQRPARARGPHEDPVVLGPRVERHRRRELRAQETDPLSALVPLVDPLGARQGRERDALEQECAAAPTRPRADPPFCAAPGGRTGRR